MENFTLVGTKIRGAYKNISPIQGIPGTKISISGTNLDVVTGVSINGTDLFYKIDNSTQVEAIVPSTGKTGPITIKYEQGSVASTSIFTVLPSPDSTSPVITNLLPNNNPVNGAVLIIGLNIDSIASVSFNNISAPIDTNFVDTITTRVPPGIQPGLVQLTIVRKNGKSTNVPFKIIEDYPSYTTASPPEILVKKQAPYLIRVDNDWFNEYGNSGDNIFIEKNQPGPYGLGGPETINGIEFPFYVSFLDTSKKIIELTINRGFDIAGDSINVKYVGSFVEAADATHQRIIFYNEDGRQIVVNTSL